MYGGSARAVPGGGGTTNLIVLRTFLTGGVPSVMLMSGVALLLVGLGFKAALVPFHMWTPDVYEGAPTSVTAYMAASAKIGAFAALLRVFDALMPISQYWLIAIQVLAVLTMFGGNILAVTQDNVKRMLAYSSIAHAGYLMVAVSAATDNRASQQARDAAFSASVFYLLAYTLMTMGAFAVLIYLSRRGKDYQTMADLKGLARKDPPSAYLMLIFMLSLGGIPGTMGFIGKWYIFNATLQAGQLGLALALAVGQYYLDLLLSARNRHDVLSGTGRHERADSCPCPDRRHDVACHHGRRVHRPRPDPEPDLSADHGGKGRAAPLRRQKRRRGENGRTRQRIAVSFAFRADIGYNLFNPPEF